MSTTSTEYLEYKKLWDVVDKLAAVQYSVVPAEIAWSPWDLLGDVQKQDEVLNWFLTKPEAKWGSAAWGDAFKTLIAGLLPKFLGSYAIKVYFEDGGFIVLRAKGWTTDEYGFPTVEFEIDLEASRDGVGNQIEPISGDNSIIGSIGTDGTFTSNGFTSNFVLSGNYTFPNSSGGGGACTIKVTESEVTVTCNRP